MNKNNQMYRMFKEMKAGYAEGNKDKMEHGARCWLDLEPENPFPEGSNEMEAFFQMQKCYCIWKRGDIDRKINRRRMLQWAEKLCELNPRQPYRFDKKAEEEEILAAQKAEQEKPVVEKKVVKQEPDKVFGVIPEEKKSWFKFVFPWKKEGVSNDSQRSD